MLGSILGTDTAKDIKKLYLKTFLKPNSSQVRRFTLIFLSNFRGTGDDQEIEKVLEEALNDNDTKVRETARILRTHNSEK